jgi:hypothetical protein
MAPANFPEPQLPLGHNFSYVAEGRERIDLIQAFDDGSKTYLQFNEPPITAIDVRDKDDKTVTFTIDQRYVVVPGVYTALQVTVAGHSAPVSMTACSRVWDARPNRRIAFICMGTPTPLSPPRVARSSRFAARSK